MPGTSLFAHRDFRLLLLGQTTSQLGAQINGVAIPLLAVLTKALAQLEGEGVAEQRAVPTEGRPRIEWRWRRNERRVNKR